jgi:hypothetical protein
MTEALTTELASNREVGPDARHQNEPIERGLENRNHFSCVFGGYYDRVIRPRILLGASLSRLDYYRRTGAHVAYHIPALAR